MPNVVAIRDGDAHDRMASALRALRLLRLGAASGSLVEPDIDKHAILAVDLWRPQRFGINGNEASAQLPGRLRKQLFEPSAEIGDAGRSDNGDLVAAGLCELAHDDAQHDARVFGRGYAGTAGSHHQLRRMPAAVLISRPINAAGTIPKSESTE